MGTLDAAATLLTIASEVTKRQTLARPPCSIPTSTHKWGRRGRSLPAGDRGVPETLPFSHPVGWALPGMKCEFRHPLINGGAGGEASLPGIGVSPKFFLPLFAAAGGKL